MADHVNRAIGVLSQNLGHLQENRFALRLENRFTRIEEDSIQNVDRQLALQLGDCDILGFQGGPHLRFQGLLGADVLRFLLLQLGDLVAVTLQFHHHLIGLGCDHIRRGLNTGQLFAHKLGLALLLGYAKDHKGDNHYPGQNTGNNPRRFWHC